MSWIIDAVAGALTGVLTGFGVGGGTLLIIYMQTFTDINPMTARGINLLYFLPTAGASLPGHIKSGFIEKRAFIFTAAAGVISTAISSWAVGIISQGIMQKVFGVFLISVGVIELFRKDKNNDIKGKGEK